MQYLPEKVHFGLGFGFKYQAMLVLLIETLCKTDYFQNGKISKEKRNYIKNILLKENTFANSENFINSLEEMIKVNKINLLHTNKKILLVEGEHHYLEDINIFFKNGVNDIIFFYQVKGNAQYKENGNENTNSIKYTVLKAIINFTQNKNLANCKNIKLVVLTNKDVPEYFFLKTAENKQDFVDFVLLHLENIKYLQNKIKVSSFLISAIRDLILGNNTITKKNILKKFCLYKNYNFKYKKYKIHAKDKDIILNKLDISFIQKLENLRYIINNLKVIEYLDHRLVYLFLKNYYKDIAELNKKLINIEIKAIDGSETNVSYIKTKLNKINFSTSSLDNIKFSKDNNKFKIGKIL